MKSILYLYYLLTSSLYEIANYSLFLSNELQRAQYLKNPIKNCKSTFHNFLLPTVDEPSKWRINNDFTSRSPRYKTGAGDKDKPC